MPRPCTALILVDLQHWIVDMSLAPIGGRQVVTACTALMKVFVAADAPVVLVRYLREDGHDGGAAAPANQIVDVLGPDRAEHVVTKHGLDAFEGTDLDAHLRGLGVQTVVVAGISTAHGVGATAATAVRLGYRAVVVPDATASVTVAEHTGALNRLAALGVAVLPAHDVVPA